MYDSSYFTLACQLSESSFAVRSVDRQGQNFIGRESNYEPKYVSNHKVLERQVDGLFCTDGMMVFDKFTKILTYLYYYRNQYVCMDSNLNILWKGRTIDTTSRVTFKVSEIRSEKSVTLSSPPLTVNKESCVYNKYLFVRSNLSATNENMKAFSKSAVIDVYDVIDRSYKFSFYLPDQGALKLSSFKVIDSRLIAIYGHWVAVYNLMPKYFSLSSFLKKIKPLLIYEIRKS